MEIINNTETERLRAAVNEALNPGEENAVSRDTWWNICETAKNDIINMRFHGRSYTSKIPADPEAAQRINDIVSIMEEYFNRTKDLLAYALEQIGESPGRADYEKYLDYQFTPTWGR